MFIVVMQIVGPVNPNGHKCADRQTERDAYKPTARNCTGGLKNGLADWVIA